MRAAFYCPVCKKDLRNHYHGWCPYGARKSDFHHIIKKHKSRFHKSTDIEDWLDT